MENKSHRVTILLASYNGELYLKEQIDSIINQKYTGWQLVLSDDCSSDSTKKIEKYYEKRWLECIKFRENKVSHGSACSHFIDLLRCTEQGSYVMCCDQDDIWNPDKIMCSLEAILREERNSKLPILVYTDLKVIDKDRNCIANSFMKMMGLQEKGMTLQRQLVQNVVTGCTTMINPELHSIFCSSPARTENILMHDWLLAILARAVGKVVYVDTQTVEYRQHDNNSVGAKDVHTIKYYLNRIRSKNLHESMIATYLQAREVLDCYKDVLPDEAKVIIQDYADNLNRRWIDKVRCFFRGGYWKQGFIQKIGQIIYA